MSDWTYRYTRSIDDDEVENQRITLTLTQVCQQDFKDRDVLSFIEVEMMQGEQLLLDDGRTQFSFSLPPDKSQILKAMFMQAALPKN